MIEYLFWLIQYLPKNIFI